MRLQLIFKLTWGGYNLPTPEKLTNMVEDMKSTDALTEVSGLDSCCQRVIPEFSHLLLSGCVLQAVKAMGKDYPTLITTLISERDLYMAVQLQEVSSQGLDEDGLAAPKDCRVSPDI